MSASEVPVLLVSELFPPAVGGSGVLLDNIYARLGDIPVAVLATAPRAGVRRHGGLDVHEADMQAPDWGLLRPSNAVRHLRIARAIRRLAPSPAVVHCARALPEGLSARLAQLPRGNPYVCWTHGEELGYASTSRELTFLTRRVYSRAAAVLANSRNSAALLGNWGVASDRIHVVHPGVDASRFHPAVDTCHIRQRIAPAGETVFLSVGRLQRRKGHDLVLSALPLVRVRLPHARYVIVGDGIHRAELTRQAGDLGVSDMVTFVGEVDGADLPAWFAACDVFLMPNRTDGPDFEGFGIVFLEAGAAGKAVVGGRSGGVPEAVDDGVTGRLVSGTDVGELAEIMVALGASAALRDGYGRAGRERVLQHFTWERAARDVAAVHRAVVARYHARRRERLSHGGDIGGGVL